jgi:hypothetical protein
MDDRGKRDLRVLSLIAETIEPLDETVDLLRVCEKAVKNR